MVISHLNEWRIPQIFYNFMSDRILGNAFAFGQRIIPTCAVSRQILINTDNVNQQADFYPDKKQQLQRSTNEYVYIS